MIQARRATARRLLMLEGRAPARPLLMLAEPQRGGSGALQVRRIRFFSVRHRRKTNAPSFQRCSHRFVAHPSNRGYPAWVKILHLYISPEHTYVGHYGGPAGTTPIVEVNEMECVAGSGIRGDRYFDYKPDFKGQITFFEIETHRRICARFGIVDKGPDVYRRNVIVEAQDLNQLIGKQFELQGLRFFGTEEAKPCFWMNEAVAAGALDALAGRGGLRAKIITGGMLRPTALLV